MSIQNESYEIVVLGGGLSGFCAAIAAARQGRRTCLIHNRPVLGGNASSEMRVTVHGAACHHPYARETGIVGEILSAERSVNHAVPNENGWTNSVFDMTLYDIAQREPLLTLHLNTDLYDVINVDDSCGLSALSHWPPSTTEKGYHHRPACVSGKAIRAIKARVLNAEIDLHVEGDCFIDCSGDALLAHLAGCDWRMGSESSADTGELHAPDQASTDTMGNSIHFRCVDTGRHAPYHAPAWAMHYDNADFFYKQGRKPHDPNGGYWWLEIGVPWNTIHDNESIRHELTRHALGVWDWMKNRDPVMRERCRTYALDFIGQVPGKRESRRIMGQHLLNENELQGREVFPDEIAYGGWFIDLHTPGGLLAEHSEPASAAGYDSNRRDIALKLIGPYGIPLRSLLSKDVPNLLMAGRNISVTHAALGTVRVMATCGLMGEAAGIAAAISRERQVDVTALPPDCWGDLQQRILRAGGFLPNHVLRAPAGSARVHATSSARLHGMGAWEIEPDANLRDWVRARGRGSSATLDRVPTNFLMLDGSGLRRFSVHLLSESGGSGRARLRKVPHIWTYDRDPGGLVWEGSFHVPAGHDGLLQLDVQADKWEAGCYRLELEGEASVSWRLSAATPWGVHGAHVVGSGRLHWNRTGAAHAFQVDPPQAVYEPGQVLTGVTRPHAQSNAWFAEGPLPQDLWLDWDKDQTMDTVTLTFPRQLVHEVHWENPFYASPSTAKRYRIYAGDTCLVDVVDNVSPRRIHRLTEAVSTRRLRIEILETHGGPAGLCEVQVSSGRT
jgi:hypothetical protein